MGVCVKVYHDLKSKHVATSKTGQEAWLHTHTPYSHCFLTPQRIIKIPNMRTIPPHDHHDHHHHHHHHLPHEAPRIKGRTPCSHARVHYDVGRAAEGFWSLKCESKKWLLGFVTNYWTFSKSEPCFRERSGFDDKKKCQPIFKLEFFEPNEQQTKHTLI